MARARQSSTSPDPIPVQEEELGDLPGFFVPPSPPARPGEEATVPAQATAPDLESDGTPDEPLDEPQQQLSLTGSSRASTDERRVSAADKAAIVGAAAALFTLITTVMHKRFAPRGTTTWIATEAEVEAVSAPLGSIAARRNPLGAAGADAGDAIQVVVAAGAYAMRNVQEAAYWATPEGQRRLHSAHPLDQEDQA